MQVSLILLAGGSSSRMKSPIPKQFLSLKEKPLALHSLHVFKEFIEVQEVIVVCPPDYQYLFTSLADAFALPGIERQDSVYNGLRAISSPTDWVMIHDAARPFITPIMVERLLKEGKSIGAAALAMPVKNTLKETCANQKVTQTLMRSRIWEIQTPQLLRKEILEEGFHYARTHQITVTDDVSLAELIGHPVHLVLGCYQNIKITTPEDWAFAEWLTQNTK